MNLSKFILQFSDTYPELPHEQPRALFGDCYNQENFWISSQDESSGLYPPFLFVKDRANDRDPKTFPHRCGHCYNVQLTRTEHWLQSRLDTLRPHKTPHDR
jgi:hypothetical protein